MEMTKKINTKKGKSFLYCYKMTHDTGFAPNPYHGILTLATCKPTIRRCAQIGDWISGWTSNKVIGKRNQKYTEYTDSNQKLIYLAKISEKLPLEEYWKKYPKKRPKGKDDVGDNIYEPIGNEVFEQHENGGGHGPDNIKRDLSGKYVLICEEFYYFGVENPLSINTNDLIVPRCKKILVDDDNAKIIFETVKKNHDSGLANYKS